MKTRLQVVNHRYSNTEMSLHTAYLIDTKNGEIMKRVGKLLLQWMTNFHYDQPMYMICLAPAVGF